MNDRQAQNALVGAWRLISWENRADDGQVTYPMGTDALGYLLYTADRRFAVTISRTGRARFADRPPGGPGVSHPPGSHRFRA
jgi:hypothetical protein